jgi:hypothetical protein
MFGPLKEALKYGRFTNNDEMKAAVRNWLCTQPKAFILMPLKGLLTDGLGKYVEQ